MDTVLLRNSEFAEDTATPHLAQLFVRSQSVVSRHVGGETLIVPVRGKVGDLASIYSFNPTGSLIWQSLESPKSLDELVSVVESEYAVERDQAERDVKQFLHDMLAADLVQIRGTAACQQAHINSDRLQAQLG
ncbi:MAG: PqqD family protein [Candidatus Sulfotelmatobacter sp.]|jgi:hypothetical protein